MITFNELLVHDIRFGAALDVPQIINVESIQNINEISHTEVKDP